MADKRTLDPEILRDSYQEILKIGLSNLRTYSLPERFDYLYTEIDHLHNLPGYMSEDSVAIHAYYYCATRPLYLERMAGVSVIDTGFLLRRYEPHWRKLREGLLPFADDINSNPNPRWDKL